MKTKAKMKTKNKNENESESENKNENEKQNENKSEIENDYSFLFSFCFSFSFWFLVLLLKSFCIFINSTWPSGAIDSQLSLDWPRSAIAFLLNPRGLEVPQTVNSLLLGLQVPIWHRAEFVYAEFNDAVNFFCFSVEILFLGKFGPKNQNYQFKQKFGTYTNSNMHNSVVIFTFSVFDWKYPFWANLVQKVKTVSLS